MYTQLFLATVGALGILLHNLVKLDSINRANSGIVNYKQYLAIERFSIMISIGVVLVATLLSQEVRQLEAAGKWLGVGTFAIGYMAQSILVKAMGKIQNYVDDKTKL